MPVLTSFFLFLCSTILPPLHGPEFAHFLGVASSSPPSFLFPLRSAIELLLGKKLRPMVNLAKSWLRALEEWSAWNTRLSPHFRGLWMTLRIERFIHLTTINTSLYLEFMGVVLKFWSKSINSFLLLFGPISITLRNITILTGLSIRGVNVLCLFDIQDSSLPAIEVSSTTQTSYFVAIWKWHDVTRVPLTVEHVDFLWVLLCRYVFCPSS